jgi:3',5'-cyclic AMP phosphodiesterase CpdA
LSDVHVQLDWRSKSFASTGWRGALGRVELHGLGRLARFARAKAQLERIAEELSAAPFEHAVLTGDLSAMGHEDELGLAREVLEPLLRAGRLTVIPGNHDRYTDAPGRRVFERTFAPYLSSALPEYADAQGYPFVRLIGDAHAVVGLDSTRVGALAQYVVGRLGRAQLGALRRVLDDPRLAGRTVHVLAHHGPLGPKGKFDLVHSGLMDWRQLLATMRGRPVVFHHGHSHRRAWQPKTAYRPHLICGGSSTQAGREGYWMLELDGPEVLEARAVSPRQSQQASTRAVAHSE